MTALLLAALASTPLERAEEAFRRGDFEGVIREAERAGTTQGADSAKLLLLEARAFAASRRTDAIEGALVEALRADPEARFDPETVQPSLVLQLETLRRTLRGELSVTDAAGRVSVDGVERGPAPLVLTLELGPHFVSIDAGKPVRVLVRPNAREVVSLGPVQVPPAPETDAGVTGAHPLQWSLGPQVLGLADVVPAAREPGAETRPLLALTAGVTLSFRWGAAALGYYQGAHAGLSLTVGPRFELHQRLALQPFGNAVLVAATPWLPALGGGLRVEVSLVRGLRLLADARLLGLLGPATVNRRNLFFGLGAEYLFPLGE